MPQGRVIFVGDVHGCHDELIDLLEKCGYQCGAGGSGGAEGDTTVVLVGDLVNKGPKSVPVVRTAMAEGFLAVRGNHDDLALSAALGMGRFARGGDASLLPYAKDFTREELEWLGQLPYTITFPHLETIVVHAGLVPGVPLEEQTPFDMVRMRNVRRAADGGGRLEPLEKDGEGEAWAKAWPGPLHAIFGHDAKRDLQEEAFATGLDTGCLYGRKLTALVLPGRELVSVPARKQYVVPGAVSPALGGSPAVPAKEATKRA